MNIAGITAEYNPFHTGHAYQVSALREQLGRDAAVAAVMSGNWVQQGRPAVTEKWTWSWSCPRCGRPPRRSPLPEGRWR